MICKTCGNECEAGRRRIYCITCKLELKRQRDREYCARNREKARTRAKDWHHSNKERASEASRRWRLENADVARAADAEKYRKNSAIVKARARKWYQRNKAKVLEWASSEDGRKASRDRMRRRFRENPLFKMHSNMSRSIRASLRLKCRRSWEMILGYTAEQLKIHLERQFLPGMDWQNYGRGEGKWHIDHIVPRAAFSFDGSSDQEVIACWSMTNLRPMWGADNIAKHASREYLI